MVPSGRSRQTPVTEVNLNGRDVHLWTYDQLEGLTSSALLQRCRDLRDRLGPSFSCPRIPRQTDTMLKWIIGVQCEVSGQEPADFGCPRTIYDKPQPCRVQSGLLPVAGEGPKAKCPSSSTEEGPPYAGDDLERCFEWSWQQPTDHVRGEVVKKRGVDVFKEGKRHARPSVEGWRDHIFGNTSVQDPGPWGRRLGSPEEEGWRDHFENDGVGNVDDVVHGMKHADAITEGWADHIQAGTVGEGSSAVEDQPRGRAHRGEYEAWSKDHMLVAGEGMEDPRPQGRRGPDREADFVRDHVEGGTTTVEEERGRGREHVGPTEEDHIVGWTAVEGAPEGGHGRKHGTPMEEGWKDHLGGMLPPMGT
ncbi:hypothetical protein Pmar_PMAR011575 [Perkinsus marinus ATCC 50983]|uniref:Uncharacterized protein n=1 Tax=Perkinsus marinus (strain ATCC 50983 / TXsc) TaxID=423536 RepID=C5LC64_PERM5|nr:hypothetical protein Pmar_PMAR011575 [Perkinsus marinus ATCC 50983]EER05547.1 hypothetical protein Pmar_PMAR011575 [Perkinsus marinus ATCC 50983]|eukprot:XP_002773731.1 hypothetical protein Pmar_PMAR011575 [Perkinsus marinus ATCC 50983]